MPNKRVGRTAGMLSDGGKVVVKASFFPHDHINDGLLSPISSYSKVGRQAGGRKGLA